MEEITEMPLRRSKRRSSAVSPVKPSTSGRLDGSSVPEEVRTPTRRSQKRVRFSESIIPSTRTQSTGITPYVRRTSLGTPRRQVSSPFPSSGEIQFTPFRQVLDERFQRRIRRNGLSEEMNSYETERKEKVKLEREMEVKNEELQKLRAQLEESRHANHTSPEGSIHSQERVDEVEAELDQLRKSFDGFAQEHHDVDMEIDWSQVHVGVTPGPMSDGGDTIRIYEDEEADPLPTNEPNEHDVEALGMALELESAKRQKRQLFNDVRSQLPGPELNFADSPSRSRNFASSLLSLPSPPKDFYQNLSKALKTTTARAEDAELALHNLEVEVKTLGFAGEDAGAVIVEIADHFRTARLELEHTLPGETISGFENAKLLPEMMQKLKSLLRQLQVREAELKSMREHQKTLKGNFDHAIIAAEKANARVRDLEDAIDTGAEEMLEVRMKSQALERDNIEKDKNVETLITALDKYREDVARLEKLITEIEAEHAFKVLEAKEAVQADSAQHISDLDAKVAAEETGRRAAEESALARLAQIKQLQLAWHTARTDKTNLESQMAALQQDRTEQLASLSSTHTEQLTALETRLTTLSTALTCANAEIDKLKIHKTKLEERVQLEIAKAENAVEAQHHLFLRAMAKSNEEKNKYRRGTKVRTANSEIDELMMEDEEDEGMGSSLPVTPSSTVRFAEFLEQRTFAADEVIEEKIEGNVQVVRGRGRNGRKLTRSKSGSGRRYDSGVGFGSDSEVDGQLEAETGGYLTPEPSSELDLPGDTITTHV